MADYEMDAEEREVLEAAVDGDSVRLGALFEQYRDRLRRLVDHRMDPRLRGRVDASDVIQEAYLDVAQNLERYLAQPEIPFYLWVRYITGMKLHRAHNHHLGTQKRDARREAPVSEWALPGARSDVIAPTFIDRRGTPSQIAMDLEQKQIVMEALDSLKAIDREVLAMRHVEQLSNKDVAHVLGLTEKAASLRYYRAATRLKELVDNNTPK